MGLNGYVVIGSAVVGLLVGLTGAGGGALMTPMLILLFSVKPAAAISSDLVAAGRGDRAPAQGHGEPAPGGADDAGLGADGVPRLLPAAAAGRHVVQPEE